MSVSQLVLDLRISADEYVKMYQGSARAVFAHTREGKKVRFPAKILVPFVQRDGISGTFVIDYDNNNRFQQIRRL